MQTFMEVQTKKQQLANEEQQQQEQQQQQMTSSEMAAAAFANVEAAKNVNETAASMSTEAAVQDGSSSLAGENSGISHKPSSRWHMATIRN